jgi:hypothetical protein
MVPMILLLAALACGALSVLLMVVGVLAIVGHVEGGIGGGVATIVAALLPLYLAYLFARSAWRIRVNLRGASARARQRSTLNGVIGYAAVLVASDLFAPVPSAVKIIGTIGAVLIVPVLLAFELEPRR